jgi:hypothetical protein
MINIRAHYANGLLEYAAALDMLPEVYRLAVDILNDADGVKESPETDALLRYMRTIPPRSRRSVLRAFVRKAHEKLELIDVEISAPYPLTEAQLAILARRIVRLFKKQPVIVTKIDESLLGGVRVIAGKILLDDSIRQKISAMRHVLYEEVLSNAK